MTHSQSLRGLAIGIAGLLIPTVALAVYGDSSSDGVTSNQSAPSQTTTRVLGPLARVIEETSGVEFVARVDTGAAVTSLHCTKADFVIADPADRPIDNIGKTVKLRVENRAGDAAWIHTRITDYLEVRSANGAEHRYRIELPLRCRDVSRTAIVNLKDRSRMTYRLLLGRDFLSGAFVVDVSQPEVALN